MPVSLAYNSETVTFSTLTADAFGYSEVDTAAGLAARRWRISGLCTPTEWQAVIELFAAWRADRMADPDSKASGTIGSTVTLNSTGYTVDPGGPGEAVQTWADVECWFTAAPEGQQLGAYVAVTCELVDAEQWLIASNIQLQKATQRAYFGTWVLGDCTLNLLQPPYTFQDVPNLQLTAGGVHFISGTRSFTRVAQLVGHTDATGYDDARTWFETTVAAAPATNDWYPISPLVPEAEAIHDIVNGLRIDIYTLSITLGQIR